MFDHRFDHNCGNYFSNNFISFITYRGVAQLVARDIWDVDAAGSNPVTPTKFPLRPLASEDFSLFNAVQILIFKVSKKGTIRIISYRSFRCLRRLHCFESFLLCSNLCSFLGYHFFELNLTFFVGFGIHITTLTLAIGICGCVSSLVEMVI